MIDVWLKESSGAADATVIEVDRATKVVSTPGKGKLLCV
jgi:hypothetical protein